MNHFNMKSPDECCYSCCRLQDTFGHSDNSRAPCFTCVAVWLPVRGAVADPLCPKLATDSGDSGADSGTLTGLCS